MGRNSLYNLSLKLFIAVLALRWWLLLSPQIFPFKRSLKSIPKSQYNRDLRPQPPSPLHTLFTLDSIPFHWSILSINMTQRNHKASVFWSCCKKMLGLIVFFWKGRLTFHVWLNDCLHAWHRGIVETSLNWDSILLAIIKILLSKIMWV